VEQTGNFLASLDFDKWFVTVNNQFAYLQEVGDPQILSRTTRWLDDPTITGGVRYEPVDVTWGYTRVMRRWVLDTLHDYNYSTDVGNMRIDFKQLKTLKPYVKYEFRRSYYDGD